MPSGSKTGILLKNKIKVLYYAKKSLPLLIEKTEDMSQSYFKKRQINSNKNKAFVITLCLVAANCIEYIIEKAIFNTYIKNKTSNLVTLTLNFCSNQNKIIINKTKH